MFPAFRLHSCKDLPYCWPGFLLCQLPARYARTWLSCLCSTSKRPTLPAAEMQRTIVLQNQTGFVGSWTFFCLTNREGERNTFGNSWKYISVALHGPPNCTHFRSWCRSSQAHNLPEQPRRDRAGGAWWYMLYLKAFGGIAKHLY